ncbi:MAG: serine/threonine protein kinase, partial [Planctomycetes bacterium]|nr:serine/threonine protein kinase [Planctomycetota bacterium]
MTRGPRQWFEELVGLSAPEREVRLAELARGDAGLAQRVGELLRLDASAGTFLERAPAPSFAAAAGRRLGRFRLVRPLGSGGMGMVWEVEQDEPARTVAIKLLPKAQRSAVASWRFAHEAQVLASLNHPGIATFFEAGSEPDGDAEVAWFAMERVPGARDVLTYVRAAGLSRDQRLQLFLRLCDAVAYGHRHGVVHRDLKPGNVLVAADGTLKLIDFGIARATAANELEAPPTRTGELVGTLHWMAPEQLRGDRTIGPACDVYGLGVLLYHLLTGEPPFALAGQALSEVARIVLEDEPTPPRRFAPDLPQDLV